MSALPPLGRNREPLAKSAPSTSASTNIGISAGSAEPSASNITTDVAGDLAKPAASALPLPRRICVTVTMPGSSLAGGLDRPVDRAAVDQDHLVDRGQRGSTSRRLRASLRAGRRC